MAQSRMAGMAMDLGPSDLADVGEATTLATNKMGMEQGQQASVYIDLDDDIIHRENDGKPHAVYSGMGKVWVNRNSPGAAYPMSGGYGKERVDRLTPGLRHTGASALHNYGIYIRR